MSDYADETTFDRDIKVGLHTTDPGPSPTLSSSGGGYHTVTSPGSSYTPRDTSWTTPPPPHIYPTVTPDTGFKPYVAPTYPPYAPGTIDPHRSPSSAPFDFTTEKPQPEPLPKFGIPVDYLFGTMRGIPRDVRIQAMRTAAFIKADHQLVWDAYDPALIPAHLRSVPINSDTHLFKALWRFLAATLMEDDE